MYLRTTTQDGFTISTSSLTGKLYAVTMTRPGSPVRNSFIAGKSKAIARHRDYTELAKILAKQAPREASNEN